MYRKEEQEHVDLELGRTPKRLGAAIIIFDWGVVGSGSLRANEPAEELIKRRHVAVFDELKRTSQLHNVRVAPLAPSW